MSPSEIRGQLHFSFEQMFIFPPLGFCLQNPTPSVSQGVQGSRLEPVQPRLDWQDEGHGAEQEGFVVILLKDFLKTCVVRFALSWRTRAMENCLLPVLWRPILGQRLRLSRTAPGTSSSGSWMMGEGVPSLGSDSLTVQIALILMLHFRIISRGSRKKTIS